MCTLLDGKSYELLQLTVNLYDAVRTEANWVGLKIDHSEISRLIDEAKALIMTPINPTKLTRETSDEDLTEPKMNWSMSS